MKLSSQNRWTNIEGQAHRMTLLQRLKPKQHLHGGKSRQSLKSLNKSRLQTKKAQSLITRRKANEGKHCDIAVVDLFAGLRTVHKQQRNKSQHRACSGSRETDCRCSRTAYACRTADAKRISSTERSGRVRHDQQY